MRAMVLWAALYLSTCVFMEGFAYVMHRWVMHGPGWFLHRSHHRPRRGFFEWNDVFYLVFMIPSLLLLHYGLYHYPLLFPIGLGTATYGVFNWAFHDFLVHRRVRHTVLPTRGYLGRIVHAHHIHHRTHTKEGAISFGFFYTPDFRRERGTSGRRAA
jgi:beta-carotene 3-hydroxylase